MHPQLRKIYVPLSCPSLVIFWPSSVNWYSRVCVHSFIDTSYSCGLSSHSILEWLGETNSSTLSTSRIGQSSCILWIKMPIQLLLCSTLECYHLYVKNIMRIAPPLMNSWRSDTSRHHCFIPRFRVILTGMPTNELWCVKSILLATLLLGS